MHIDRWEFEVKCRDVMKDIQRGEATSPAWIWMIVGAAIAFVASCIKISPNKGKPILISRRKVGSINGIAGN